MTREFKIARIILLRQKPGAQRAGIIYKVLLKTILPRADVRKQPAFLLRKRDDGPLVKNDLAILGIHLLRAGLDLFVYLIKCHKNNNVVCTKLSKSGAT